MRVSRADLPAPTPDPAPAAIQDAWGLAPGLAYGLDAFERGVLFLDTMRRRGNRYAAHASAGEPGRVERVAPSVPMQRGGDPIEVARTILWLASHEASYITATIVNCSGGR